MLDCIQIVGNCDVLQMRSPKLNFVSRITYIVTLQSVDIAICRNSLPETKLNTRCGGDGSRGLFESQHAVLLSSA